MHEALRFRIDSVKQAIPENAPILYQHGALGRLEKGEEVDKLFKNGRATVSFGFIGLFETVAVFYGSGWQGKNIEANDFALEIMQLLDSKVKQWRADEGYWYSLYSTPAESLTDKFNVSDAEKFGVIKDITDKEYYTNSYHFDVREKPTPFEKIDFEAPFARISSGGFIHYVEFPNIRQNLKALETVWDYSYKKVGYFGTNTPIDKCFECGFEGDFNATERGFECPSCGNHDPEKSDVVKRICGYLGNVVQRPVVNGRKKEIVNRVKHLNQQID